jgi:hypothetical protein
MLLATDEEHVVVGFTTFLIRDGVAELEDLFVDPGHRHKDIAELLVLDISMRLRELGFETLEVTGQPSCDGLLRVHGVPCLWFC